MAFASINQASVSGGSSNALSIQSDGIFMPRLSTGQRTALALTTSDAGLTVYDFTLNNLFIWNGTAWESIPGSGDAGANGSVQYNDNGIVSGASNFVYDKVTSAVAITGDLTVDTSTLKVDSTNDRVGIGTASPAAGAKLGVTGATVVSTSDYIGSSTWAARFTGSSNGASSGISFLTNSSSGLPAPASIHATPIADYRAAITATYSADGSGAGYFAVNRFNPTGANTLEHYKIDNDGVATWSNVGGVAGTAMTLNSTGLLIGTANGTGDITNAKRTTGGIFTTVNNLTIFVASGAATTIFAAPAESTLLVTAYLDASGNPTAYNAVAIVKVSGGVATITTISSATLMTITLSGLNVQATQTSGGPARIYYSAIRIS